MGSGEKTPQEWLASGSLRTGWNNYSASFFLPRLFPHLVPPPYTYPESLCLAAEA